MADSYVQLPVDSTGSKLRTRTRTVGASTVHEQSIWNSANPTWHIWTGSLACAQNKLFLCFLNTGAQVFKLRKLFLVNTALAAVTGVGVQFDFKRITAIVGGTTITPQIMDSTDTAIASVTCVNTATSATEGAVLFPWYTNNDEIGVTNAFFASQIQALMNLVPEGVEVKEPTFNQNEGFAVKQITSSAVGSYGVLAVVTKEP